VAIKQERRIAEFIGTVEDVLIIEVSPV